MRCHNYFNHDCYCYDFYCPYYHIYNHSLVAGVTGEEEWRGEAALRRQQQQHSSSTSIYINLIIITITIIIITTIIIDINTNTDIITTHI